MFRKVLLRGASAGALTLVVPLTAQAQESLPTIDIASQRPATGSPGKPGQTPKNSYVLRNASAGTKTDTPVMNTPINVQTITERALDEQQAITLQQAIRNVSGVFVPGGAATGAGSRSGGFYTRGFAAKDYYRDGVRMDSGSFGYDIVGTRQLANVEKIEVLKGPAAILYGLSEPGGLVNISTKQPLETPYYAVDQKVGSLALYRTAIDATGPLTQDKAFLYRVNLSYERNGAPFGSFVDSTRSQNFFFAPVIKWNLSESTSIKGEVEYSNDLSSSRSSVTPLFNRSFITIPRNTNFNGDSYEHLESVFAALSLDHRFDSDWSIKQRVTFNQIDRSGVSIPPFAVLPGSVPSVIRNSSYGVAPQTNFSTNVDVVGHFETFGAKHTLLLGGDFYRRSASNDGQLFLPWGWSRIALALPFNPGVGMLPLAPTQHQLTVNKQDTAGLYIQDQIDLPFNLFLLAGMRWQYIRQTSATAALRPGFVAGPLVPDGEALVKDKVTPRVGLLWRPMEWVSFYGNYTEGFGANSALVYPGTIAAPSDARSWEAGVKLELFDGALRANADYYDLVKTNIPIGDPDVSHICGGVAGGCSIIAGEARSRGPEVDIQGTLLPGWDVIATYANMDVRVTSGNIQGNQLNGLSPGQRFPHVPRNLASLWTTYEFQDVTFKGLKVGAGYTYHGSQPIFDRSGNPANLAPLLASWGTVDLMGSYTFDLDGLKTTAQLNVTNLFDRTYYTDGVVTSTTGAGFQVTGRRSYGPPFAVLGSLRAEF